MATRSKSEKPDNRKIKTNPRYNVVRWTAYQTAKNNIKFLTRDMFSDKELADLHKKVYYQARSLAGVHSPHLVDDLAGDTFLLFMERLNAEPTTKPTKMTWREFKGRFPEAKRSNFRWLDNDQVDLTSQVIPWFINSVDTKGRVATPYQTAVTWLYFSARSLLGRIGRATGRRNHLHDVIREYQNQRS